MSQDEIHNEADQIYREMRKQEFFKKSHLANKIYSQTVINQV
jgi:hypothetical protein